MADSIDDLATRIIAEHARRVQLEGVEKDGPDGIPVRLAVDPAHPWYRPDAGAWRIVSHGWLIGGAYAVDTVAGWCEGYVCTKDPATGRGLAHKGHRIRVEAGPGTFQVVPASAIPPNPAIRWLHNMMGAKPIVPDVAVTSIILA